MEKRPEKLFLNFKKNTLSSWSRGPSSKTSKINQISTDL
jgi:hypothetical protein